MRAGLFTLGLLISTAAAAQDPLAPLPTQPAPPAKAPNPQKPPASPASQPLMAAPPLAQPVPQRIVVTTKGRLATSYEIITGDGSRDLSDGVNTSRGAAGKRVWRVLNF